MSTAVILMIEDNPIILRTNRSRLEMEGYRVLEAGALAKGKELAQAELPDLILLDILLPDGNGLDYCRDLFGQNGPSILFLSALDTKEDVIAGLRAGGDDYLTKPYLMEEMLMRVEALLRRYGQKETQFLKVGSLELRISSRRAYLNGTDLLLSHMEFGVLEYLSRNRGRYVTAQEMYETLWEMDTAGDVRTVWEHISRLRSKLSDQSLVELISKRNSGYRLITGKAD